MLKFFRRFRRDDEGVTAIEYGLIAALIGVAIVGGATILGDELNAMFEDVGGQLQEATADGGSSTTSSTTSGDTSTTSGDTSTTTTSGG